MADINSVTSLLKEIWAPAMESCFSDEIVALSRIERTSEGVTTDVAAGFGTSVGRYVIIPLHVTRSSGIGSRAERTTLPSPGQQSYSASKVRLRTQYAIGDITSQALDLATGNPQSFINALEAEQDGLRSDAMYDYARQVYGAPSGSLGTVSSYAAGVVTLDATAFPYGNEYFQRGMKVDVLTSAGVLKSIGAAEVTAVSASANTVTLSGTYTTDPVSTDIIVRSGSYNQEINGWNQMVQTSGTYQELTTASVPEWTASSLAVGGAYNEKHVFRLLDKIRRVSSKAPTVLFTGCGVWRSAYDSLDSDRRFVNTVEFAHGVSGLPLQYHGKVLSIVDDIMFPENPYPTLSTTTGDMLAICEDVVKVYRHESGWSLAEETGAAFIPAVDRTDAWEFRLRQHSQLGTSLRNAHGRLTGITITA